MKLSKQKTGTTRGFRLGVGGGGGGGGGGGVPSGPVMAGHTTGIRGHAQNRKISI